MKYCCKLSLHQAVNSMFNVHGVLFHYVLRMFHICKQALNLFELPLSGAKCTKRVIDTSVKYFRI